MCIENYINIPIMILQVTFLQFGTRTIKRIHQLCKQGNVGRVNERYYISEYAKSSSDHSIMHFHINIMRVVFTHV